MSDRPATGPTESMVSNETPRLREMRESDVDQILAIEVRAFPSPWKRKHFLHELRENPWAVGTVVEYAGRVVAYACVWFVDDELRINNLAVHRRARRRGIGSLLLAALLDEARRRGCREATLEVRPSNLAACELYRRHGFREIGRRRNYYAIEGEDAIVMRVEVGKHPRVGIDT